MVAVPFDSRAVLWQSLRLYSIDARGQVMANPEWGTKRLCPTTGKRFYDLGKTPIISPYTGEVLTLDTGQRGRISIPEKVRAAPPVDDDLVVEDDAIEDDSADVELEDELLDDDDDDTVSLDEIADVGGDDEDV